MQRSTWSVLAILAAAVAGACGVDDGSSATRLILTPSGGSGAAGRDAAGAAGQGGADGGSGGAAGPSGGAAGRGGDGIGGGTGDGGAADVGGAAGTGGHVAGAAGVGGTKPSGGSSSAGAAGSSAGAKSGAAGADAGGAGNGGGAGSGGSGGGGKGGAGSCPDGMVLVGPTCVDRYEGYVVEVDAAGNESPHSPYDVVDGLTVRAKVAEDVVPQGYISQVQAAAACESAGKRLCTHDEFLLFCRGPDPADYYPYGGETHVAGDCNEGKGSSVAKFFGSDSSKWTYADFNDPILNQWAGGLGKTGEYVKCVSPYGIYDCVGNLHEWGADAPDAKGHGRFRGGFYGDAEVNGPGCLYVTSAHEPTYHDYSTGFRCCMDAP